MEELAVFGGKPVREKPIFYGRQYIDQEDVEAVTKVLTADDHQRTAGQRSGEALV